MEFTFLVYIHVFCFSHCATLFVPLIALLHYVITGHPLIGCVLLYFCKIKNMFKLHRLCTNRSPSSMNNSIAVHLRIHFYKWFFS